MRILGTLEFHFWLSQCRLILIIKYLLIKWLYIHHANTKNHIFGNYSSRFHPNVKITQNRLNHYILLQTMHAKCQPKKCTKVVNRLYSNIKYILINKAKKRNVQKWSLLVVTKGWWWRTWDLTCWPFQALNLPLCQPYNGPGVTSVEFL